MNKNHKQQGELPGMPKRSALGDKAIEYLNARGDVVSAQEDLKKIKAELVIEFQKSGLSKIKVSGNTLSYSHKESDSIRVKEE